MRWSVFLLALCLFLGQNWAHFDQLNNQENGEDLLIDCEYHNYHFTFSDSLVELFKNELKTAHRTKTTTPLYEHLIETFRFAAPLKRLDNTDDGIGPRDDTMCVLCNAALGAYVDFIREGASVEEVAESVLELCLMLNISTERVCSGAINGNVRELWYIVNERPNLTTDQLCGIIFQSSCPTDDLADFEWTVNVDPNKPALTGSKDTSVLPNAGDLTVAHITDPHYDPSYMVGSWAACDEYNCCRYDQPIPAGEDVTLVGAGRWGDYRDCDSPLEAVIDAFTQIRRNHQVGYFYLLDIART